MPPRKKPSAAPVKKPKKAAARKKTPTKKAARPRAESSNGSPKGVTQAPPARETYAGPRKGNLIIVESPAKAKTIEKYLGSGFRVRASYGHVRDLPVSGKVKGEDVVGVDIAGGWKLRYQVIDPSEKGGARAPRPTPGIPSELKREAGRAEKGYLAT